MQGHFPQNNVTPDMVTSNHLNHFGVKLQLILREYKEVTYETREVI
jgi:hypothetical protein